MDGIKYVRKRVDPRSLARANTNGVTGAAITVKPPLEAPQKVKKSLAAKVMPVVFGAVVIGMLLVMVLTGRRQFSPYMLMMPLSMIGGLVGFNMHGGGGEGDSISELDANRKEYYNYLSVTREEVHKLAKQQFMLQQYYFPDPNILGSIIDREEFWARQPNPGGGLGMQSDRSLYDPYLSVRLGLGKARINPALETMQTGPSDYLEPVTAIAFRRFMRTQSTIHNMPIAVNLSLGPNLYIIGKDHENARAFARAIIMNLCITHSPEHVLVAVVTPKPKEHWEFMKWLPHCQHPDLNDIAGNQRMVYLSAEQASEKLANFLAERPGWTKPSGSNENKPLLVIVLDRELTPDAKIAGLISSPRAGTVIIDLAADESEITSLAAMERLYFLNGNELRSARNNNVAKADKLPITTADVLSRKLAPYRVPGSIVASNDTGGVVEMGFLHALGVDDPATFDPREIWEKTARGPKQNILKFPLGIKHINTNTPTNEYAYLDIKEAALAGWGPHGVLQGMTGTGKSYLMRGWILGALTLHSPEEINFICVDFKGYTTFQGLAGVPHIISIITNMEEESDLMDRFADVIDGEIMRRQRMFRESKTTDYVSYNKLRQVDNSLEPMPALILMLDETQQFLKSNKDYITKFETWGAIGRSLRIHIVLCQQTYDTSVVGGFDNHRTYGISLTASSTGASSRVVGVPDAAHLPRPGWAILYGDEQRCLFKSFNISKIYVPSTERAKEVVQRSQKHTTLKPFSVLNDETAIAVEPTREVKEAIRPRTEEEELLLPREDAVLADRLTQFGNKARQMWLPPLNMPITFADLPISSVPTLQIPIGLSDAPKLHARPPLYVNLAGATANIRIVGSSNSGKSLAVQTLITGLCLVQPPDDVNIYIIDNGGGKLSYLDKLPHVGGYARPNDLTSAHRIAGEFIRIMNIRKELFFSTQSTTVSGYIEMKKNNPMIMKEDPYGRMYVVIDGWKTFTTMSKNATGFGATKAVCDELIDSLREGTNYGVHVIITARTPGDVGFSGIETFRTSIQLAGDEAVPMNQDAKALFKAIPTRYPGRGIDIERALHMRIAVPQIEPLSEPEPNVKIIDVYNDQTDYSAGTAALIERILGKYDPRITAPRIAVLSGELPREEALTPAIRQEYAGKIVIGISESDGEPRFVPPSAPSFVVYGDPGSGKTTVLRNYIQSIIETKSNAEARFIIFDYQRSLLGDQEFLQKRGYLNSYITDHVSAESIAVQINKFMQKHRTMPKDVTVEQIQNHSWWNPEYAYHLYIVVDDYNLVTTSMGNPLFHLLPWIATSRDTGIHFVISRNAGSMMKIQVDKILTPLQDINTPSLLLSGPKQEKLGDSRFAHRRPGQGELVDPASSRKDVIQCFWMESLH